MCGTGKRIGFGIGAGALVMALAGTAVISSQNLAAQGPAGPGRGGPGGAMGRGGRGGPGGPMGPGGGVLGPMMIERLGLSQDQMDRVRQIVDSHREEQQALGERGMAVRDALEAVISADTLDEYAVRARAADVAAVEADQTVARARIYAEVFQILTSEQQGSLKTMQAERRARETAMRANREQRREQGR